MRATCLVLVVAVFLSVPRLTSAQSRVGSEFQVNTYTTNQQDAPAAALDAAGNFVVVWQSAQDGHVYGVFGRRFSSTGVAVGTEFQVNTYTTGFQGYPAVGSDAAGNFVVVWVSAQANQDGNDAGLFGQRFSNTGSRVGSEFQVNTYTTGFQGGTGLAIDGAGAFVVVWKSKGSQDGDGYGVFGQRFASNGTKLGAEFQVNTYTTGNQGSYPQSIALTPTGFVVVWEDRNGEDRDGYGVFGQRFDTAGARLGTEFQVNTYTTGNQDSPAVTSDAAGNFVVVWESEAQDGSSYGLFGQRFSSSGARLGSEFQVNTYTMGSQVSYPASNIAADTAGNFVVVWNSKPAQDGDAYGVFGQRFNSSGQRLGTEFQVNTFTTSYQGYPTVVSTAAGSFLVVWQSGCEPTCAGEQDGSSLGVFAQRYAAPAVAPRSQPAPALGRVGLIGLGLALAFAGGALVIRRQRRA